jgi:hypothetical protein
MKKITWIVIILAIIIFVMIGILVFVPAKKITSPVVANGITIISSKANAEISSPLVITGVVNGDGWSGFEGQVGTVKLLNASGGELVTGVLIATTEWTTSPTNFEATITFNSTYKGPAVLSFRNENPSGMPEQDKYFILPVIIK